MSLSFKDFAIINRRRCEAVTGFNHQLSDWSLSDWFTATLGELGEAANLAKKLNRVRDGIPGNTETPEELQAKLQDEVADVFIYLDLLAQSQGFALEDAVRAKFQKTSDKIGYRDAMANERGLAGLRQGSQRAHFVRRHRRGAQSIRSERERQWPETWEFRKMSVAIGDDELREFVNLLRDWRLAKGVLDTNALGGGETGRAGAYRIERERREKLLTFLDLPGFDVAFEAVIAERHTPTATTQPLEPK